MYLDYFRANIKSELKKNHLTLNGLSEKADLSEDTLRSLIYGKSQDVKISTMIKIADALDCSIDYLIGRYSWFYDENLLKKIQDLPPRSIQTIQNLISLELKSTQLISTEQKYTIPVLILTGNSKDGDYYDNSIVTSHDISNYPEDLRKRINLGIKINNRYYEPVYFVNDILLLSTEKIPEYNDIVVYQSNDGRLYVRRYTPSGLEPIDQFGKMILTRNQDSYTPIRVVIKAAKEFNIEQYR